MTQLLPSYDPVIAQLWPSYCPVMAHLWPSYSSVMTSSEDYENEKLANWGLAKEHTLQRVKLTLGGSLTNGATPATL